VDRHEDHAAVAELADRRSRVPCRQLVGGEVLARVEDGLAVADEQGPTAEGTGHATPARWEDQPYRDVRALLRLGLQLRRVGAGRDEHRAIGWDCDWARPRRA